MSFYLDIQGMKELEAKLRKLPEKVKVREVANIASRSLRPVKREAEAIMAQHSVTGNARKAIMGKRLTKSRKWAGAMVGWNYGRRRAPHWKFVEFGITDARPVVSKRGLYKTKGLQNVVRKDGKFMRRVNIPGVGWRWISSTGAMPAIAPMRKAIASYGSRQGRDFIKEMEKYVKRKAQSITKKYGV